VVFFQEEPLSAVDAMFGPRGAQGVPLTPWRSIAVDRGSIPYGTPVWLSTQGPGLRANKLVMAQDTGGAIVGAVRIDYFTGWGSWSDPAYTVAAQLKQPVRVWALWPR
jgi:membrane-bound lytic murein transglycosylase A